MALTLRLDEETNSYLIDFMFKHSISTSSKAIGFMIRNFDELESNYELSVKSYKNLEDEFYRFTDLVKQRELLDKEINSYSYK